MSPSASTSSGYRAGRSAITCPRMSSNETPRILVSGPLCPIPNIFVINNQIWAEAIAILFVTARCVKKGLAIWSGIAWTEFAPAEFLTPSVGHRHIPAISWRRTGKRGKPLTPAIGAAFPFPAVFRAVSGRFRAVSGPFGGMSADSGALRPAIPEWVSASGSDMDIVHRDGMTAGIARWTSARLSLAG